MVAFPASLKGTGKSGWPKPETAETDPDPEIPALWDDTGGLIEDAPARVERGGVQKAAVLGCFAGTYFMRSKQGAATFPVDRTPRWRLELEWRKFRSSALGENS